MRIRIIEVANQGIHHSLRNSVIMGIIEGAIIGGIGALSCLLNLGLSKWLISALVGRPNLELDFALSNAPGVGFATGISGALLTCILTGGLVVWRHYVIRFLVWESCNFPWKSQQFLDDATARFLLRRVGGGYSFTHRLLLEHLADAEDTPNANTSLLPLARPEQ